jgi:formylglycine-generating enzyme required for sulfatase activity
MPFHTVSITYHCRIGTTEVTQAEFETLAGCAIAKQGSAVYPV